MEKIKCKECGKELSSKAEICPNCGVRIKKKGFISKAFRFFEIIGVLIVISLICVVVYVLIRNGLRNARKNSYVGTWELISNQENVTYTKSINYNGEPYTKDYIIIIDKELVFEKGNVYDGIGSGESCNNGEILSKRCENTKPQLRLYLNDKVFAIDFNTTTGDSVLLCFEDSDKNTIKQISCKGTNDGNYSANGGIDEDFDIVYKKVK